MRSESMVVTAGRSVTDAGTQKHLLARLDRLGRMALWSRHQANICEGASNLRRRREFLIQGTRKKYVFFAKQDPGWARQDS